MIRIKNAHGILSTEVPTGRLLWVDQINGVDKLAKRGRLTIPFKTLTAAKLAAASGDTIMVLPGTYNEKNLLKNGVNWHFLPGAKVTYTGSDPGGIFDTSSNGSNGAVDCLVTGYGEFAVGSNSGSGYVVNLTTASALVIEARSFFSQNTCVRAIYANGSAFLHLKVMAGIGCGNAIAIVIDGPSVTARIETAFVHASAGSALAVADGYVNLKADLVRSASSPAVHLYGASGLTTVNALDIVSDSYTGVLFEATDALLHILNARISGGGSGEAGRVIDIRTEIGELIPPRVKLTGCVLISADAAHTIAGVEANTYVQFNGNSAGNAAYSSEIIPRGGDLLFHSEIS